MCKSIYDHDREVSSSYPTYNIIHACGQYTARYPFPVSYLLRGSSVADLCEFSKSFRLQPAGASKQMHKGRPRTNRQSTPMLYCMFGRPC